MTAFLRPVAFLIIPFLVHARVPVCASLPSGADGDCYPLVHEQYGIPKATEETCRAQGCCWRGEAAGAPSCAFPTAPAPDQAQCNIVTDGLRIPCYSSKLYAAPDQATCEARGCCFRAAVPAAPGAPELPACFFPSQATLYSLDPASYTPSPGGSGGFTAVLPLGAGIRGPFNTSAAFLALTVIFIDQSTVRVTIRDANNTRWEVPDIVADRARVGTSSAAAADYVVSYTRAPFGIKISRKSTGDVLFDSTPQGNMQSAGLVFENQFLQLGTSLSDATPHIYGLGEHISSFELPTTPWQRFTTYAHYGFAFTPHEQQGGNPSIGVHPFYMQILSPSRQAHGVFLLNSNPAELILQAGQSSGSGEEPEPASLTYRTNGGVLDFFVMLGPTPSAVVEQYTALVGRPFLVPYWSLGFHLCRYGYNTLANTKAVVTSMKSRNVPHDTQWNDIDHMYKQMDFTTSPARYPMDELGDFVRELHDAGMRYVVIVDPAPAVDMSAPAAAKPGGGGDGSYEPGASLLQSGAYLHRSDGTPLLGVVWPNANVSFPDFLNPDAATWWAEQIRAFRARVDFDGKWIDMNEPQNFCYGGEQPYACRHISGFTEQFNENANANGQGLGWYTFTPNNFTRENPSVDSCTEPPRGQGTAPSQPALAGADYTGGLLYNATPNLVYSQQVGVLPPFDAMRQPWLPGQMAFPTGVNPQGATNMVCAGISYNLPAASAQQQPTLRYNAHSLYGWGEAKATFQGLLATRPGKRPFVLSRNTFPGSGRWAGHWLGDNTASWENLRQATAGLMMMGLFGIPMVGTDICGFFGVTTPELCIRWQQAGAFYPFSRNHNMRSGPAPPGASATYANEMYEPPPAGPEAYPGAPFIPPQAPSQFLANETAVMRDALLTRYAMMPYLYTHMVSGAHMQGTPLLRPMLFEFPHDSNTYSLGCRNNGWRAEDCSGLQWMLGDAVLVTPVLEKDAQSVTAYFPNLAVGGAVQHGGWYDILSGLPLNSAVRIAGGSSDPATNWTTLPAPITRVPVYVRAGRIVPLQDPCHAVGAPQHAAPFAPRNVPNCATTTTAARQHDFSLIVAADGVSPATGSLFWDDGDSIDSVSAGAFLNVSFTSYCNDKACWSGTLKCTAEHANKTIALPPSLTKITVYGVTPASLTHQFCLSGAEGTVAFNATHSSVVFTGLQLSLAGSFSVSWSGSPCSGSASNPTALIVGLCVGLSALFAGMCVMRRGQYTFSRRRAMLSGNAASFNEDQGSGQRVAGLPPSGGMSTPTPDYTPPGYTDTGAGSLRASHSAL